MAIDSVGSVALDLMLNSKGFEKGVSDVINKTAQSMKSAFDTGPDLTKKMQSAFDNGVKGLEKMKGSSNEVVSSLSGKLLPVAEKLAPTFAKVSGVVGNIASGIGIVVTVIQTGVSVLNKVDDISNKILGRINEGIAEVTSGIKNTINAVKKLSGKATDFESDWSNSLRKIGYLMATVFSVRQLYDFLKTSVDVASQTQSAWVGLSSIINAQGKSFKDAKKFIEEYTSDGLVPLNNAVTAYKNLISAGYTEKQAQDMMDRLKDSASFGRQAHLSLGDAVTTATEGIKNQNSTLTDNAGVTKNLSVMYADYARTIGKGAGSLTEAEKRTATYNGMMKETAFQMGDAQKITETYAGKVARLSSAFTTLKTAVGNVVIPIVEVFIPIITKATETVTRFFNSIADLMAQFGLKMKTAEDLMSSSVGGVGSSAVETAEDVAGIGDVAEETAKKMNSAFNSVDEINVLDTSKGSASGSGSGSDIGATNKEMKDALTTVEQGESIIDKAIGKFYEAGMMFAEKINEAMGSIDWESIKKKSKEIATNIGDFLNGFVAELDWSLLGRTIGEGINTALIFANTYFTTFNWKQWGESLARGLNSIVYSIDWNLLGETIANYFNTSIDTALGFVSKLNWTALGLSLATGINSAIKNIHWKNISDTLIKGINGATNALYAFVANTNWDDLADNMITTLNDAIEKIDWKKTGKAISGGIKEVLGLISKLLKEVNWKDVIEEFFDGFDLASIIVEYVKIKMELSKMKWQVVWEVFLDVLKGGFLYIGEKIITGWKDWFVNHFIDPWKELANSEGVLEIGVNFIIGIFKGITGIMTGVVTILKGLIFDPIVGAIEYLFGIHSPSKVFAEFGKYMIEGLWQGISNAKTWLTNKWKQVKGWFTDVKAKASVTINTTKEWVKSKWTSLTKEWKDKTAQMKANVSTKWSDLRTKWNSLMSNFKDKTITVKAKVGEVVGNLKSTINNNIIKPLNSKLPKIFPKIPLLAQGGWFDANNPQLAIVGDNKREPEIVAPESKIEEAVMRGLARTGNGGSNNKLELEILVKYEDGRRIIKKINDYQVQQGKVLLMT